MHLVSNYLYSYQTAQEGIEKVVHFASAFLTHLLMPGSRFSSSPANVVFLTERRRPRLSKSLRQLGSYPSIEHHSWTCEWRQQQYQYGQRKICHLTIPERMWNILYQKNPQILRQLITKLSFTQRCSLIYFASVHLYCATNDLENIYSISYWIYHFSIREDFFNEQHKRIVMALHSSPLVGWCLFVFFFIVVLIMYIFQHFCSQVLLLSKHLETGFVGEVTFPELPKLLYVASTQHVHPQRTVYEPEWDQVVIDHQRVKCPRKTLPWKSVLVDSLWNLPIAGSLADSELSFGRFSTKNMNNFLMSASLE